MNYFEKSSNFLFLLLLVFMPVALKSQENAEPLQIEASFTGDLMRNFTGGLINGNAALGIFNAEMNFDTEKAGLWQGGNIFVHGHSLFGNSPSAELIGDVQTASNIEGISNRFIYEAYYMQTFGQFSALAGLHDLNSVFFSSDFGSLYLNSSFGIGPNVASNHFASIFPVTTFAGVFQYQINNFAIAAGLYNHGLDFIEETTFKAKNHFFRQGFLAIGEIAYSSQNNNGEAVYKFGANFRQCNDNNLITNGTLSASESFGVYAIADQPLFTNEKGHSIGIFGMAGYANTKLNPVPYFFAGGINLKGINLKHGEAEAGLAFATAHLKDLIIPSQITTVEGSETVIELTFKIPVHKQINIQPDLQYILNPGGSNTLKNALVGFVRLGMEF